MTTHDERDVETVAEALIAEGAAPGSSLHSWRCEHPDQYGECDCVAETARAVLDALDLPARDRRVAREAQAAILRFFADEHVRHQTPARMAEDLHELAAVLDPEGADDE